MLDFLFISTRMGKGNFEIYPKFIVKRSEDLMIRGGKFYAIWDAAAGLWSTDEYRAQQLIDQELDQYQKDHPDTIGARVMHVWDSDTGIVDKWKHYVEKSMSDNFKPLDEKLIFSNSIPTREDYASKRLPYPLVEGPYDSWDELIGTLYSERERHKIEWAIGSIVDGASKDLQKFLVFYGSGGTGKSTIIGIIEKLFQGYCATFDAKAIGSANASFALEPLKNNPLVAIQHDGDLSHIEDNTRLNSIVSHELLTVDEKFKSLYSNRFKAFLILGTNRPVKITDAKSGIIRRLIDVQPSGNLIARSHYNKLMRDIDFELSGIAYHCLQVFREDPGSFDNYIPSDMIGATNDFYNFVLDSYDVFKADDGCTLREAWERYKTYVADANVPHPYSMRVFKEELKNYFREFTERYYAEGFRVYNKYSGFITDKFVTPTPTKKEESSTEVKDKEEEKSWLTMTEQESVFDKIFADCPAQYASEAGTPITAWDNVKTTLSSIDTHKVHYVRPPENLVVLDFDICDESGNKSFNKNFAAAIAWPATYAEVSKSGSGIHLHYIYKGDVTELRRIIAENVEIKVFTGKSSLRRRLTICNSLPIATISSGLPIKEGGKMISENVVKSERGLRNLIERNLRKEIHPNTKPSVDFIYQLLEDAYNNDVNYDVRDLRPAIMAFANESTHQAEACLTKVSSMKFTSAEPSPNVSEPTNKELDIVFFDVEVFPNLFVVCWKPINGKVQRWINPTTEQMEWLIYNNRLVGFNNRRYDNHIIYARMMGYTNDQLYALSQRIINGSENALLQQAYGVSYTDIYDFSSDKKSLKKFEIEYGIHHQELGFPWDEPVPEDKWNLVAEYCENDVMATQVVWEKRQGDFLARMILADLTGLTVNDTTNTLTTKLIFGDNKKPQTEFVYTKLGGDETSVIEHIEEVVSPVTGKHYPVNPEFTCRDTKTGQMIFPGYVFDWHQVNDNKWTRTSTYRGEDVGEGGYVFAVPGMYGKCITKDVTSMHPHSAMALHLFGDRYTKIFTELVHARVAIKKGTKSGDFSEATKLFNGRLAKYLDDKDKAKMLVNALKIAINSVYGLTAANFTNAFKDPRNVDNIVAKRGALFMINLCNEVLDKGGRVVHIKTDSIKVENLTDELDDFICAYGALYGYSFETEHVFDRLCLVNNAVFIGKCSQDDPDPSWRGKWEATGKQFQVPYVFKTLFSHEPIEFEDMIETMSVQSALYLDMNENLPNVSLLEKELDKARKQDPVDMTKIASLEAEIAKGHHYIFVGKTGAFCPIAKGCNGGLLMRLNENTGKYSYASGAKGYRWMEAEVVKNLHKEADIDRSFYNKLVDGAVEAISEFGDFEAFVS